MKYDNIVPGSIRSINQIPLKDRYDDQTLQLPSSLVLAFMSDMGRVLRDNGDSAAYRSYMALAFAVETSICSNLKAKNDAASS